MRRENPQNPTLFSDSCPAISFPSSMLEGARAIFLSLKIHSKNSFQSFGLRVGASLTSRVKGGRTFTLARSPLPPSALLARKFWRGGVALEHAAAWKGIQGSTQNHSQIFCGMTITHLSIQPQHLIGAPSMRLCAVMPAVLIFTMPLAADGRYSCRFYDHRPRPSVRACDKVEMNSWHMM